MIDDPRSSERIAADVLRVSWGTADEVAPGIVAALAAAGRMVGHMRGNDE